MKNKLSRKAKSFEGILEEGNNSGFESEKFETDMMNAGWRRGEPWCMAFVKMVVLKSYPRKKEVIEKTLSSGTQISFQKMKNDTTGTFEFSAVPKKNVIVIWQNKTNSAQGHAGIVTKVNSTTFETIEGNTNIAGEREGQLVGKKTRTMNETSFKLLGFFIIK